MQQTTTMRLFKYLGVLFSVSCILSSCGNKEDKLNGSKEKYIIPDSLLKTLKTDTVKNSPLQNALTLTGMVDFNQDRQVNIYPLISGNIQDIKVQLGDYVTAGQALAVVKSSEMAGYSNNLVIAETNLKAAKKQLDATDDLFKSGLASQIDLTNAQVNYDQAQAQLDMVKKVLKINGNNTSGEYIVKAPINGFIVQKNITNNMAIRPDNGNALFTISDLNDVWIQANVYEADISKVHLGDDAMVTTVSYPDRVFKGKIDKILNVLDPNNKIMRVRVVLSNKDYALKPQMFTSVTVTNKEKGDAISISSNSLIFDHSQYFVLIYHGKGIADITPVQVLHTIGNKVYLTSGVKEGDIIIASNTLQIYDQLNN